jgi:hypothetical protein
MDFAQVFVNLPPSWKYRFKVNVSGRKPIDRAAKWNENVRGWDCEAKKSDLAPEQWAEVERLVKTAKPDAKAGEPETKLWCLPRSGGAWAITEFWCPNQCPVATESVRECAKGSVSGKPKPLEALQRRGVWALSKPPPSATRPPLRAFCLCSLPAICE